MAITLRKQADAAVASPSSPARVSYYVDSTNAPKTKDSLGSTASTVSVDGSPIVLADQVSAPATVAGNSKVYAKDVSGTSELFFLDGSGNEVQMTSGGSLNLPAGNPSTYFANQFSNQDLPIAYVGGSGPSTVTTTVAVPMNADQCTNVFTRFNLVTNGPPFSILGWRSYGFVWQGGAPVVATDITSFTFNDDDTNIAFPLPFTIEINPTGTVSFTLDLPGNFNGNLQVCLSAFDLPFTVA